MSKQIDFDIQEYAFNRGILNELDTNSLVSALWPVVYVLSNDKTRKAYVGETTDAKSRMAAHLRVDRRRVLSSAHLISSEVFNKSATLDIESNLIKYMAADGKFTLQNSNVGLANHNYYQKEALYWQLFEDIWDKLWQKGVVQHSLEFIGNSDLFKYSPYKSLTEEQCKSLVDLFKAIVDPNYKQVLVHGGAGTGKTILAVFLFKLLHSAEDDFNFREFADYDVQFVELVNQIKQDYPDLKMALVVPMTSFRNTIKSLFSNVKGLKPSMVIGPNDVTRNNYDFLVVDEAHRLRRRVSIVSYGSFDDSARRIGLIPKETDELEWVQLQSKKFVLFYDHAQSVRPSDVRAERFETIGNSRETKVVKLQYQIRVKGGAAYVNFVDQLFKNTLEDGECFENDSYEIQLYTSLSEMVAKIQTYDEETGLSRLVAGFAWPWVSKNNPDKYDIELQDVKLRWNKVTSEWINTPNAVEEVGCIHTTQGYDLNYTGVIFGPEIGYDLEANQFIIRRENYHDRNGRTGVLNEAELEGYIQNIYKTLMLRGIRGTLIYVCDPGLREFFRRRLGKSQEVSVEQETPIYSFNQITPYENCVPFYDLKVAAGVFGEPEHAEEVSWLKLPHGQDGKQEDFACRVYGESMNRIIPNGSICLFKRYAGGTNEGKIVLCEHTKFTSTEFGSSYTVKKYSSTKQSTEFNWAHQSIVLSPYSDDTSFEDIVLENDELEDFKIIGIFERVLH